MKLSPYRRNLVDYVKANGPRVLVSGSKKPVMMTDEQAMQWLDDRVQSGEMDDHRQLSVFGSKH
ncbi:hypothetical protein PCI56_07505 [Plesiomonas shigelloides subsp. oncorhynchi]|nr:hypothetical protein [Plesiomonas shigelloides]